MPTISYHSLDGRLSSTTVGVDPNATSPSVGGRIDLLSDALGSVVRTVHDDSINGGETLRYAGYGSVPYEAGGWAQPRASWVGTLGYRSTQLRHAERYVRARHYATSSGRWTTVDPVWPSESAYGYVDANPTNWVDPTGMQVGICRVPYLEPISVEWPWENCRPCLEKVEDDIRRMYGNLGYGRVNAMRHCVGACVGMRKCGGICTFGIQGRELWDIYFGSGDKQTDAIADRQNNYIGFSIPPSQSCAAGCQKAFNEGKLELWYPKEVVPRRSRR